MPPWTRFAELAGIASEHDGAVTSLQARQAGISPSVLSRLAQRGRLERIARGVYRIPWIPAGRLSQYRETILWIRAHRGPRNVALSHETALAVYGITDASPSAIHLTVPSRVRLRRAKPRAVKLHRSDLAPGEIRMVEGLPLTSIARTVRDLLESGGRSDLIEQAISEGRREGFISGSEARQLRRRVRSHLEVRQHDTQGPTGRTSRKAARPRRARARNRSRTSS